MDGAAAPLTMLPRIVDKVGGATTIMMDGGVRRGTPDVLKAIALGARMVFLGRPFMYPASVGGEAGVAHAISLLDDEVDRDMGMLGVRSVDEVSAECLSAC